MLRVPWRWWWQADMASQLSQITESRLEEDELIHVEGTVIHHFVFAVRQDVLLAKELLNVLRLRQCSLSAFEMALLFSLVRIDKYSTKASEMLRKSFLQDFAHQHKIKLSPWVSTIDGLAAPSDIRQLCSRVLRRSVKGWDQVVPGIVSFGMAQLEWGAKKCSPSGTFGRPAAADSSTDASSSSAGSGGGTVGGGIATGLTSTAAEMQRAVAAQLVQSCSEMLEKVFRQHTSVRDEILGQILSRVLTRDESVKYVVHLLARITGRCSKDVIDCLPKIKESLEYLAYMPHATAVSLIRALEPVLRLSSSLLDYLIIILRKALFSREEDARMVALEGFLLLAQGNLSVASASASKNAEAHQQDPLALELIGQLRRTMAQQVQMRERFYDGLCDVVRAKPYLIEDVAATLFPQLQRYCLSDGSGTRIMLEKCVDDNNMIVEPIGKLLRAVAVCVALKTKARQSAGLAPIRIDNTEGSRGKEAADEHEGGVIGAARGVLDKLASWIADTDPEDFDMDRETDFNTSETQHLSVARLLVGMHEVLFEHVMLHPQVKVGQETKLFRGIRKMYAILELVSTAKAANKGGAKGRKGSALLDDRTSLFSYTFARQLLAAEDTGAGKGGHVDLTADSERALRKAVFDDDCIMSFALETAQRQLLQAGRSMVNTAIQQGEIQGDRKHVIQLAPLLLRQFYLNLQSKRTAVAAAHHTQLFKGKKAPIDKDAGAELSLVSLHGLQMCIQLACAQLSRTELGGMASLMRDEFESIEKGRKSNASVAGADDDQVRGRLFDAAPIALASDGFDDAMQDPAIVDSRIAQCIKQLQKLCSQLLEDEEPEYGAIIAETIYVFQGPLSLEARLDHEAWAQGMCKNPLACGSDHQALTKALLANLLRLTQCEPGLNSLIAMGNDMLILFREPDEDDDETRTVSDRSPEYDIVREDTRDLLFSLTTDAIKGCCEDVEWVWDSLELNARPDLTDNDDKKDSPEVEALVAQMNFVEDEALRRLNRTVDALLPLSRCLENEYGNKELVVKALTRVYRAAEYVAKKVEHRKAIGVRKPFVQLMVCIGTQLNDALYELLLHFDVAGEDKARGKRQKINNESRLVPQLVYHVELLEAHLIKIQKAQGNGKSLDLMKHFKRSTARDFKIDYGVLQKASRLLPRFIRVFPSSTPFTPLCVLSGLCYSPVCMYDIVGKGRTRRGSGRRKGWKEKGVSSFPFLRLFPPYS